MPIIPMKDLKNTTEIERRCNETDGPVYITKNGYGSLVVMSMDYYERTMGKIREASIVNKGLRDIEQGHTTDGREALDEIRRTHTDRNIHISAV